MVGGSVHTVFSFLQSCAYSRADRDADSGDIVLRCNRIIKYGTGLSVLLWPVGMAFLLSMFPPENEGEAFSVWGLACFLSLLGGFVFWWSIKAKIHVGDRGVRAISMFGSVTEIDWDEITSVERVATTAFKIHAGPQAIEFPLTMYVGYADALPLITDRVWNFVDEQSITALQAVEDDLRNSSASSPPVCEPKDELGANPSVRSDTSSNLQWLIALLVLGTLSGAVALWVFNWYLEAVQCQQWPTVKGNVAQISVVDDSGNPTLTNNRIAIKYTYQVAGTAFRGDRFNTRNNYLKDDEIADRLVKKYRNQPGCIVKYQPSDPQSSFIDTTFQSRSWGRLIFAVLGAIFAAFFYLVAVLIWLLIRREAKIPADE